MVPEITKLPCAAGANMPPTAADIRLMDLERKLMEFKLPCQCRYCLQQYRNYEDQDIVFLAYHGELEDTEVATKASSYAKSINQDRHYLHRLISLHGDTLIKKWKKRKEHGRIDLLKNVQPALYPVPNTLLDLATQLTGKKIADQRLHHKDYLVPYLNVETLSKDPGTLIRLLHNRITWHPTVWVLFDNALLQPAWNQGCIGEPRADGCIMMTSSEYGTWRSFDPELVHKGEAYGSPRALLILEAQELLMGFLRRITSVVLADIVSTESPCGNVTAQKPAMMGFDELDSCCKWRELVDAEPTLDANQPWSAFGTKYNNPFGAPPVFDIDSVIEIAENQTLEIEDELWLLQTEPQYFHDRTEYHESRWMDRVGGLTRMRRIGAIEKQNNIAYFMTIGVLERTRDWQWLLEECRAVKQHHKTYLSEPNRKMQLLELYEHSLGCLRIMVRSVAFRPLFYAQNLLEAKDGGWGASIQVKDYNTLHKRDRIGWCLYLLTRDREDIRTFAPMLVLQYLEHYLASCPEESNRLDSEMHKYISNLAAVEHMSTLLDLHRPIAMVSSKFGIGGGRQGWQYFARMVRPIKVMLAQELALGSVVFPLNNFRMPKGRKDEEWLAKSDRAHDAITQVWRSARAGYQRVLRLNGLPQTHIDPQLQSMSQCESPELVHRRQEERKCILARLKATEERNRVLSPLDQGETDFHVSSLTEKTNIKHEIETSTKTKIKSRPTESVEAELSPTGNQGEHCELPPILYTLKQKSKAYQAVSKMLLVDFDGEEPTGNLRWLDFVTGMLQLGFKVEHGGGSAFTFRGGIFLPGSPEELQERRITFHRPHPHSMDPVMLQFIGKRLSRNFGWERANFAVTK